MARAELYADMALRHGDTPLGTVRIHLDFARAPRPVANFVGLATGQRAWIHPDTGLLMTDTPFYDGLIFHRLIHSFMIQGGDPSGIGQGGPGYHFQDQFHPELRHEKYRVSMAHAGPNSNGSQFFILLRKAADLDDFHSVFGVITDPASRAIIDGFTNSALFATAGANRPLTNIVIETMTIGGDELEGLDLFDPALNLPTVKGVQSTLVRDTALHLQWPTRTLHEYQIGITSDVRTWHPIMNYLLAMNDAPTATVDLPEPPDNQGLFLHVSEVDYSHTPIAPTNLLQNGAHMTMDLHGGVLSVAFGSGGPGNWETWAYDANNTLSTGLLTNASAGYYGLYNLPIYPNGDAEFHNSDSQFRYLAVRALYLAFSPAVGPWNVWEVEAHVSFHDARSGSYNDAWYNANVASSIPQLLRGSFTWTPPE